MLFILFEKYLIKKIIINLLNIFYKKNNIKNKKIKYIILNYFNEIV